MSKTGIVILNYNNWEECHGLACDVYSKQIIDMIVIVDNASTDDSVRRLKEYNNERYTLLCAEENKGYSCGNNIGCRYLVEKGTDILFIANPDVAFDERFVRRIVEVLNRYEQYAMVSGVMKDNQGNVSNRVYLRDITYWDDIFSCFAITRLLRKKYFDTIVDYEREIMDVEAIPGSLFAIKSSVLKKIGYMDENTFLYYEEIILGKKIKAINKSIGIIPSISYIHNHSTTINKVMNNKEKRRIYEQSKLYYERKYCSILGGKYILLYVCSKLSEFDAVVSAIFKGVF